MSAVINVIPDCNNGFVSLNISFSEQGGGNQGFEILLDSNVILNEPYHHSGFNFATLSVPGDLATHNITIRDVLNPNCSVSDIITSPDCSPQPCNISVSAFEAAPCDSNNNVTVDINVSAENYGINGFNILVDNIIIPGSPFSYDPSGNNTVSFSLPGDGSSHNFHVVDVDSVNCTDNVDLILSDCSVPCVLSNLNLNIGNPVNHTVLVEDFQFNPNSLDINQGDSVTWLWTGAVPHTSTSDAPSGPNAWNSGLLSNGQEFSINGLALGSHPYFCEPHGAPGGV